MSMQPRHRRILLTGATGGIGSALSRHLAADGADLVLACISKELLLRLQEQLGGTHSIVAADIASEQGRREIIAACKTAGGIDAIINLAGILDFHLYEEQSEQIISATLMVNLLAPMLLCHALVPQLKQRKHAVILNVGSIFGSIGHPGFVAYCASKGGLESFSEALARELADTSVRVAYIAPRATQTGLNPDRVMQMNRALGNRCDSPDLVAAQIVKLLRGPGRVRYLGWPEKMFVRVNALVPEIVHKALAKKLALIKDFASQ